MDTHDVEQVRLKAREIAHLAQVDRTFREQIKQDPAETLAAAGLPEEFVGDFLRETGLGDVVGYGATLQCLISTHAAIQDYIH